MRYLHRKWRDMVVVAFTAALVLLALVIGIYGSDGDLRRPPSGMSRELEVLCPSPCQGTPIADLP